MDAIEMTEGLEANFVEKITLGEEKSCAVITTIQAAMITTN